MQIENSTGLQKFNGPKLDEDWRNESKKEDLMKTDSVICLEFKKSHW